MLLQEMQRFVIETCDIFIHWSVRTILKDEHLRVANGFQPLGKASRSRRVMAARRDQRRSCNCTEPAFHIVSQHCRRLPQKAFQRLCRAAAHEIRQRLNVFGLSHVKIRREAPGKEYANPISGTLPSDLAAIWSPSTTRFRYSSVLGQALC